LNWLDVLFLALIVLHLVSGYRQGLARQLIGLVGLLVAIAVAVYGSSRLGAIIAGYIEPAHLMPLQEVSNLLGFNITVDWVVNLAARVIAFLVLLVLARILLGLLAGTFTAITRIPVVGTVNRLSGSLLGLARALILILLLVGLFSLLPVSFVAEAMAGSTSICIVERYLPSLVDSLKSLLISYLQTK